MKNKKQINESWLIRKLFFPKPKQDNKPPLTREIVKAKFEEVLNKKIKHIADAVSKDQLPNFAINIYSNDRRAHITAFDPVKFQELLLYELINLLKVKDHKQPYTIDDLKIALDVLYTEKTNDFVLGYIFLKNLFETGGHKCHHSWETTLVAAEKGKGPLLYSVAASFVKNEKNKFNKITPHRSSVRPGARDVWKITHQHRDDFEKYEFDDAYNPKTPQLDDDCDLHSLGFLKRNKENMYLNFAYEIKSPINYQVFIDAYKMSLEKISKKVYYLFTAELERVNESLTVIKIMEEIDQSISGFGNRYFERKYHNV